MVLFPLENLQKLDSKSAARCQSILGHGSVLGIWETPEDLIPHMSVSSRRINLRRRLVAYLPKETTPSPTLELLLDEGVLWLTRLALLMRMGPAGVGGSRKLKSIDPTTIAAHLFQYYPKIAARGIARRLTSPSDFSEQFVSALNSEDLQEFRSSFYIRLELKRLTQLNTLGFWLDAPPTRNFKGAATQVRGATIPHAVERNSTPHPPIPDDYLAAMAPRVLWLIKDLGPNLIHLLETLSGTLTKNNTASYVIRKQIKAYFETNVWRNRDGLVIDIPPFDLRHGSARGRRDLKHSTRAKAIDWPPTTWSSIQALAASLQAAHLWIALLVMAARIGEIATLKRECIEFAKDGQIYANGKTYKPSVSFDGRSREWPVPDILMNVFAQQVKLIQASERLARIIKDSERTEGMLADSTHLWASLGASGSADATKKLGHFGENLQTLALRIGLTDKPGGKNLHPHRFRKTLARLAGLAIDGSQKVLMALLGHDDVTTTLGYMQSDPAFAKEVDDITRELRVIRGETLIQDMRASLRDPNGLPYGGHGGGGAAVLAESVQVFEEELHRTGHEWGVNTARELSVLLTNNGESARLISAHVVCTKTAREIGLCSPKKGSIVIGNCKTECRNHIEDKAGRRDTERVIPILIQHAKENIANNDWLPLQRDKMQLEKELCRYDDIGALWRIKPDVQAILGVFN